MIKLLDITRIKVGVTLNITDMPGSETYRSSVLRLMLIMRQLPVDS